LPLGNSCATTASTGLAKLAIGAGGLLVGEQGALSTYRRFWEARSGHVDRQNLNSALGNSPAGYRNGLDERDHLPELRMFRFDGGWGLDRVINRRGRRRCVVRGHRAVPIEWFAVSGALTVSRRARITNQIANMNSPMPVIAEISGEELRVSTRVAVSKM